MTLFEDLDVDMSDAELHTLYRPEELVVDHTETVADIAFCENVLCTFWKFEGVLCTFWRFEDVFVHDSTESNFACEVDANLYVFARLC